MSYDYSENILVQESAGKLLRDELGWDVAFAYNTEVLGEGGTFGRRSYKEILLTRYFREALARLNPWITPEQIEQAQKTLESRLSTASAMQINEEKYYLLRDGIPVTVRLPGGKAETRKAAVLDFQNPENNYFLAIKELKIHGELYRRRTDIVGFVNGVPLLFVELKKTTVDVQNAYDDNYTDYQETVCLLVLRNHVTHIDIDVDVEELVQDKRGAATYPQIQKHVLEQTGLKVSTLNIAQIKRKCGLDVGDSYNKSKSEDARVPQCPPEKEKAIMDALRHFGMIK